MVAIVIIIVNTTTIVDIATVVMIVIDIATVHIAAVDIIAAVVVVDIAVTFVVVVIIVAVVVCIIVITIAAVITTVRIYEFLKFILGLLILKSSSKRSLCTYTHLVTVKCVYQVFNWRRINIFLFVAVVNVVTGAFNL